MKTLCNVLMVFAFTSAPGTLAQNEAMHFPGPLFLAAGPADVPGVNAPATRERRPSPPGEPGAAGPDTAPKPPDEKNGPGKVGTTGGKSPDAVEPGAPNPNA